MKRLTSYIAALSLVPFLGSVPSFASTCYEEVQVQSMCQVQLEYSRHWSSFHTAGQSQQGNSAHFVDDDEFAQSLSSTTFLVPAERPCMITVSQPVACATSAGPGEGGGETGEDLDNDGTYDTGSRAGSGAPF